jgi:hypothetical protein
VVQIIDPPTPAPHIVDWDENPVKISKASSMMEAGIMACCSVRDSEALRIC